MSMNFAGRVAIVTGAGGGLGKCHALELARRGAKVVVNDLGGSVDGTGGNSEAALQVVDDIKSAGGEAIANGASVSDEKGVAGLVSSCMDAFGRVDILINNAGILRDKSFHKMTMSDFRAVVEVHLFGAAMCSHAVWPIMREQGYGRIVMTTSPTGLYGNFGQANYGAAKLAQVGLMNSLKIEGAKYNIHSNAISPVAATRMTQDLMPEEALSKVAPELVTPAVMYLCSEEAPNGIILQAQGGSYGTAAIVEHLNVELGDHASAEDIAEHFEEITDLAGAQPRGRLQL